MSVYEITLLLNGEEQSKDIIEHNGKQYRKVKRKAAVGELVVVTDIIDEDMRDMTIGTVYKVVSDQRIAHEYPFVNIVDDVGATASADQRGYEVLELVDTTPTLTDLVANLAQEVTKEKKLRQELAAAVSDLQDDVTDLEDRLDENEKYTEEVIGRMNDLGAAAVKTISIEVIEKVLAELKSMENEMFQKRNENECRYQRAAITYHGEAIGIGLAIDKINKALRND